ncbi:MAG: lactonase family protein [Phycisphaerae bacterium]|nr:lactonase family protein [Phycisphaerae bacterium]
MMNSRLSRSLPALLIWTSLWGCAAPKQVVYVAVGKDQRIAVLDIDGRSGQLVPRSEISLSGQPGSLAISPDRRFLFAAVRNAGAAAALAIDPKTGDLQVLGETDIGGNAAYLSVDASGRYLLGAYYRDGKAAVHAIGPDGRVRAGPIQAVPTAEKAHSVLLHPDNRFAFVPHTGPNQIFQFTFDASKGRLSPAAPAVVTAPEGAGPRHYCYHPVLDVVYFVNELGSSVTAYGLDADAGTLTALQTLPTLPDNFTERNSCADVHITPDGRYLYASNRGHNSLAAYAVDGDTGRLTFIDRFETEAIPREFAIDTTGRFLYAAGQKSGRLAAYRIDPATGRLNRFATYDVGRGPAWVTVIELPR